MSMTRKGFLEAAGGGAMLLILQACGGGGDSSTGTGTGTGTGGPTMACGAAGTAISGNHGHEITIPVADLDSTVAMTYNIQGTASHNHMITITVAQLQMLKEGQAVTVGSSVTLDHAHNVTSNCVNS